MKIFSSKIFLTSIALALGMGSLQLGAAAGLNISDPVQDVMDDPTNLDRDLLFASIDGDVKKVQSLLVQKADINVQAATGTTALKHTAENVTHRRGDLTPYKIVLEILLKAHAKVDLQDVYGRTALMEASWGSVTTVEALLGAGARVDLCDKENRTALDYAVGRDKPEIATMLLLHGAHVTEQARLDAKSEHMRALLGHENNVDNLVPFLSYNRAGYPAEWAVVQAALQAQKFVAAARFVRQEAATYLSRGPASIVGLYLGLPVERGIELVQGATTAATTRIDTVPAATTMQASGASQTKK